jgi:hypothetical protein
MMFPSKAALAVLLMGPLLALGPSQPANVGAASLSNDRVAALGGWVQRTSGAGPARGYITFVNPAPVPMVIDAVTSPLATTVVLHSGALAAAGAGGGLAHLYCGDPPADPPDGYVSGNFDTNPLVVPARSTVSVAPGHGWLALAGLGPVGRGLAVPLLLYLDDGSRLKATLAVL